MANTTPTFGEFQKSGFYSSANIPALQEQLANNAITAEEARSQAEAMYKPAYDTQRVQAENQLAELGVSRDRDISKINSQYDKTLNGVMAGLTARGMGRSSLVSTRGVETENARNAAISDTSYQYLQKQNELNANLQQAGAAYAQSVEQKATEIKRERDAQQLQLMAQIAQMQQNGYSAYANYMNQRDSVANEEAKLRNQELELQNNKAKLENEKLSLANEKYRLKLAKKKR